MKINNRLLEIISFLKENNITTIKEISQSLNLSERSVRYEIDNLNFFLKMNMLPEIKKENMGEIKVNKNFIENKIFEMLKNLSKNSKENRKDYIKFKLLVETTINITIIAKELDISRTTIKNDLSEIEKEFNDNNLVLKNNTIIGKEKEIRDYFLKNYSKKISTLNNTGNIKNELLILYLKEKISVSNIIEIKKFLENILDIFKNKDNNFYEFVFSYLFISILRIKQNILIENVENKNFLKNIPEYNTVSSKIKNLEKAFSIKYNENEKLQLTDYILGFVSYTYNTSIFENWIEVGVLVKNLINKVNLHLENDISRDEELIEGLLNHIKPTIYRLKNNLILNKEIYIEAIEEYPDIFYLIKDNLSDLEKLINKEVPDFEIALFTLHFLSAIERNKYISTTQKKKILLLCAGGVGTSMLVRKKMEQEYKVEIIDVISYFQISNYDLKNVDIIISTIKLDNQLKEEINIPAVEISPFFSANDQETLNNHNIIKKEITEDKLTKILEIINDSAVVKDHQYLVSNLKRLLNDGNYNIIKEKKLLDFISPDKIIYSENINDWKESINISGNKLVDLKHVNEEYICEVINTIETFGSYFVLGNNIAIPHGQVFKNVYKSSISVLFMKEPVIFPGNKSVSLIFFLAALTKHEHLGTLSDIFNLAKNENFLLDLNTVKKSSELYNLIKKHVGYNK